MSTTKWSRSGDPEGAPAEAPVVFDCVRRAVCRVLELAEDAVHAEQRLVDLRADSLAIVEIAELMEAEVALHWRVHVHVDDVSLVSARTVGDLADELGRLVKPG